MTLIGRVLAGRYEILEEVGNGGMAVVYKARCQLLNRFVAVKVLRPDLQNDQEFVRRFNIEAQAAASLAHPNIVSIYDVGYEDGLHYIVMEYIEGRTLKDYIEMKKVLHWREAVEFAIQIAKGLEQAHKNSIVHRDIKPHNIIMTTDGVLKVTDFGIARANVQTTVTCVDSALGSVHYISPEQARGGYTDARSDIYSLAVVLYEMLTGRVPFDSDRPVTVAIMHLQDKPVSPREYNISIPLALERIIMKALSKEVSARYNNVSEMIAELQNVLTNTNSAQVYFSTPDADSLMSSGGPADTKKITPIQQGMGTVTTVPSETLNVRQESANVGSNGVSRGSAVQGNGGISVGEVSSGTIKIPVTTRTTSTQGGATDATIKMPVARDVSPAGGGVSDATLKMPTVGINSEGKDHVVPLFDHDEEMENPKLKKRTKKGYVVDKKKSRIVILIAILSALLLVGGVVAVGLNMLGFFDNTQNEIPTVPAVEGLLYTEAVEEYENADEDGVQYKMDFVIEAKVGSDQPENTILEQSPAPGTKLKKDQLTEVKLTISAGNDKIILDDYYKWDKDEARVAIKNLGLTPEFTEVYSEDVPKGMVVSQNPLKDASVKKGSTVTLSISKGKQEEEKGIAVDNYVGKTDLTAVEKDIEDCGFMAEFVEEYHQTAKKGEVFSQIPEAGTKLAEGEKITLYVSKGPETKLDNDGKNKAEEKSPTDNGKSDKNMKVKWLTVYGPKDKESALVEVKMDGSLVFSKVLEKNTNTLLKLESINSKVEVEILYDGVSKQKNTVELY